MAKVRALTIAVVPGTSVDALALAPRRPRCGLVLAHGAGAGMDHPFMVQVCEGLAARSVATLRYQFPSMQRGSRRPDRPPLCHHTVRAAALTANELMPRLPWLAGGKSFGGRMTSQAQALSPLPHIRGLCFLGFPLQAPKKPAQTRADHLALIRIPMLFLQGAQDAMANPALMREVVRRLEAPTRLELIAHADHGFHVRVRSGTTDHQVLNIMLDALCDWAAIITG